MDIDYDDIEYNNHRSKNFQVPPGVHIMNKNEAEELRRIKKETGLSEEEIRKIKTYRIRLSNAQKQKGDKDDFDRITINLVKSLTKTTKLPVQHPEFKEKLKDEIEKQSKKSFNCRINKPSVDDVIANYLRLRKKSKEKNTTNIK